MAIIREHNITTNEVVEREMNSEELNDYELKSNSIRAEQRAALLERLGITQEEAKLLLG
jgi:hypothetical protein